MKKFISLSLSLLMLMCVFSGCQKTEDANISSSTTNAQTTENTTQDSSSQTKISSITEAAKTAGTGVNKFEKDGTTLITYDGPSTLKTTDEVMKGLDPESPNKPLAKSVDTKITVNGHPIFVYETGVAAYHSWFDDGLVPQLYTPVAYFDFEGKVTVEIDVTDDPYVGELKEVTISPLSENIQATIKGQTVSFEITKARDYTVTFNDDVYNAVHIFASEPDTFEPDDKTIVIGPGEWTINSVALGSDETIYLMGGAVLHSHISGNTIENAKIVGRGILDGSHYPCHKEENSGGAKVPINIQMSDNVDIEGITILGPNCWVLNELETTNCSIKNVHIVSGRSNGDGITLQSCKNLTIEDCFVRSWDDSLVIKNYTDANSDNIKFKNISVWTDLAQSMEIGYETNKGSSEEASITNISFENITVIYNFHKPVISIHNADDAMVKDIKYKNIVVENANMGTGDGRSNRQLIDFSTAYSGNWSRTEERGNIRDVSIENVKVLKASRSTVVSRIAGSDKNSTVENVTIKDLVILGKKITSSNYKDSDNAFTINEYTKNISFK